MNWLGQYRSLWVAQFQKLDGVLDGLALEEDAAK
jgi:hypothetical protein